MGRNDDGLNSSLNNNKQAHDTLSKDPVIPLFQDLTVQTILHSNNNLWSPVPQWDPDRFLSVQIDKAAA